MHYEYQPRKFLRLSTTFYAPISTLYRATLRRLAQGFSCRLYQKLLRALNDKLDSFTEAIAALNTGLIRLKADAEVEKAAKEAAESGAEEAADSFAYLTGCDIRNYKSNDIKDDNGDIRSDVQKQLTAYTTCMTELNRATRKLGD